MQNHATSSFEVKSWDEKTYNEVDGRLKLTRSTVTFGYHGDLEGEGAMEYLMTYRDEGSATVIGLERISGTIAGKSGTFVLEHHGDYANGTASGQRTIVRGSGTGALEGIHGHGTSTAKQSGETSLSLDYELG
jgi:hypothetical protein